MKTYDPEIPLISIHIPKCGGTSLKHVLRNWFKENLYFHYVDEKNNQPPEKHKIRSGFILKKFRKNMCIHGHFNKNRSFGVEDYYPEVRQFITFLRDPFELHISNYFYKRKMGNNAFIEGNPHPIIINNWTLEDYLINRKKSFMQLHFPDYLTRENYKEILEKYFVYVGIVEDMQVSVDHLAERLGKKKQAIPVLNRSERSGDYDPALKEIFLEHNEFEMELYAYVKDHLRRSQA